MVGLAWLVRLVAQTPDASLRGLVHNSEGQRLPGVRITVVQDATGLTRDTRTDERGEYSLIGLPVGRYRVCLELAGHQALEQRGLELAVAEKRDQNFTLTSAATLEGGGTVNEFFQLVPPAPGLPVETIASSVSVVLEESRILLLPLATRNIFSLFLLQPGVTSQGAIVRRGMSFSVHGQRVSGSNYLLDGVDNNNLILTGPVVAPSAEGIQEFRMVNSSFSAENGRATAFVAQVVTRAGSNRLRGSLFEFLSHDRLGANTFANNAAGRERSPLRHNQFGYSLQGPLRRNRFFFSSTGEWSRRRSGAETEVRLPSPSFVAQLPETSLARRLLAEVPPVPSIPTAADPTVGVARYTLPSRIDTFLSTQRLDYHSASGRDRLLGRHTLASTNERTDRTSPGYPSLQATDDFQAHNSLLGWIHGWDGGLLHDLRLGWNRDRLHRPRPRPDIPLLQTLTSNVSLPASRRQFDEWENNNVVQISDLWSLRRGRSAWTAGLEYRHNLSNSRTTGINGGEAIGVSGIFPDGFYLFPDLRAFGAGQPLQFSISVDRFSSGALRPVRLERYYRSADLATFVQNDLRLTRRLSLNLGLRYEYFGVPHNLDPALDVNFYFGPGATIEERLAAGVLRSTGQNPGELRHLLYRRDRWNLGPSIGLAWDPWGHGRTVFRAGYAVALDRIFDAARDPRFNNEQAPNCLPQDRCTPRFTVPGAASLPSLPQTLGPSPAVLIDENLRTPYVQNWYAGMQHSLTPSLLLEIGHAGSVGRKLASRDAVNRGVGSSRLNSRVLNIAFLSNAGSSNYLALELALRRRFSRGFQLGASYTYSHAIDNQSDIVEGIRLAVASADEVTVASFTRQFDARADRGSANFDQRQNLVFHAIWDFPRSGSSPAWRYVAHGWSASVIGAYRSGFPVTILGSRAPASSPDLRFNRVDFVGRSGQEPNLAAPVPVPGGVQWLDRSVFLPAVGHLGTLGRGAVPGPGFWNYDFALIRHFATPDARFRLQFRAEGYNLFNHANLSPPVPVYNDPNFGRAYYGRSPSSSRFGELPLDSPARRLQLALRLQF